MTLCHGVGCRAVNTGCDGDCDCRSFAELDEALELERLDRLRAAAELALARGVGR